MEVKNLNVFNRSDFRKWLEKNHNKERKISLIIHKKHTGKPFPTHKELMEEAICFGWIDTTVKRIDEDTYLRNFVKRNEKSRWSENTLRYARELIKKGKMTPEGLKFYKEGLKKPVHDYGIPKNPDMPLELKEDLSKNKLIEKKFNDLSESRKKIFYRWILSGKMPETRKKRIGKIIQLIKEGKKDLF